MLTSNVQNQVIQNQYLEIIPRLSRIVGIDIKSEGNEIFINKMDKLPHSLNIAVPGDPSTFAFFAASVFF